MEDHKPAIIMILGAAGAIVLILWVLLAPNGLRNTDAAKNTTTTTGLTPNR